MRLRGDGNAIETKRFAKRKTGNGLKRQRMMLAGRRHEGNGQALSRYVFNPKLYHPFLTRHQETFSGEEFHPIATSSLDAANASPPWSSRQGSSFATLASPSTSPSAPRTVWGTTLIAPASPDLHPSDPEHQDDGWLASWEQELRAENEAIAQVQALSLNNEGSSEGIKPNAGGGGGKKKKAKKITLMSTTARRAA
jgi:hypothetical protein